MKVWSRVIALLLAVVLGISLAGCSSGQKPAEKPAEKQPEAPKVKDSITIALQGEPTSLDPQFPDDGNMRAVTDNVFEGLLELDGQTLKPKPALATEYKVVNPTTWEFKLRSGVKFHNGETLTADDVVFSVTRIIDPKFKSQIAGNFSSIKTAKKVDDSTVQIITNGPDPAMPVRLTLLKIMNKKHVESVGDKVTTQPVGTGPYKVTEWNRGVHILVERFDQYWGNKPSIPKAKYRFIQEGSTRLSALKAGEIDLAVNLLPEYAKEVPQVATAEGLEFPFIRLNHFKGIMANKLMRLAVNYAIDKEAIAKNLFGGYATVAQGQLFKPGYVGFNPNLKPYPYDPEKAKELIKQAGYKGEKIQLIAERGRYLKDGEFAEAISMMLRDVGLNVELKYYDWQEWLKTLFNRERAPDMMYSSHGNEMFDADRTFSSLVHSKGPMSSYNSAEVDKKIDQARTEMDPAKRQKLYEEIGQMIYDDPAFICVVNLKDIYGLSKDLQWKPRQDSRITLYEMKLAGQ
ncbi:MAG TPA: ABC transporter substrate-binding protein [Firmicutes bacterium]|nr:ABC transporter substrate-binding protein [Bacillota bacterium]